MKTLIIILLCCVNVSFADTYYSDPGLKLNENTSAEEYEKLLRGNDQPARTEKYNSEPVDPVEPVRRDYNNSRQSKYKVDREQRKLDVPSKDTAVKSKKGTFQNISGQYSKTTNNRNSFNQGVFSFQYNKNKYKKNKNTSMKFGSVVENLTNK